MRQALPVYIILHVDKQIAGVCAYAFRKSAENTGYDHGQACGGSDQIRASADAEQSSAAVAGNLLGDMAVAQIGATSALFTLITEFVFGLNNGLTLIVSKRFGAGDREGMKKAVCWTAILSMGIGVLMACAFLIFRIPIMSLLHTPEEAMEGALKYISVIFAGIPLSMAYNLGSGLLQAVGNSVAPLLFLLVGSIVHIVLNFLFMGAMQMGVAGAAAATVISQGMSAVMAFVYIYRHHPELRIVRYEGRVGPAFVLDALWTGVSMAMMTAICSIGSVILQSSINALGSVYIAAHTAARRFAEMFYAPGLAAGTAIATYTSQNYGAGQRSRLVPGIAVATALYNGLWVLAMIATFGFGPALIRLITGSENAAIVENTMLYLKISIPCMPPMTLLVVLRNVLQGMRHRISPLIASIMEMALKVIFALWVVPGAGFVAVCACEPVTWIVCLIFILIVTTRCRTDFRQDAQVSRTRQTA